RDPSHRVGGADFGHIELAHQRELKEQVLSDSLVRQGRIAAGDLPEIEVAALPGDDERGGLGWRTRLRLHVDPATGAVGPYAARSHTVVPVRDLPLAVPELAAIAPLREFMSDVTSVDLVAPSADDPRMLLTYQGEKQPVGAEDIVFENVFGAEVQVRAGGFWQVHTGAAEQLYAEVAGAVDSLQDRLDPAATNLDLYGGVGLLAAAFLDAAGERARITSVESVESATDLAAENLAEFSGAQALTARVEDYLRDLQTASAPVRERVARGTVVLDPPRNGAGGEVCSSLIELRPANIIYVACDPVAFARDTATLQAGGYQLGELHALDMFPHTHHFESIAIFTR
ncbi:MAG: class I SAM-dependent RNA methyltransferase, partial [Microbacteriaceae bacterium]|nr:class I SAM-dependent RNA methyltransferase [Microbacteriaceae bacterium]